MYKKDIRILNVDILPGTSHTIELEVAKLHTRTPLQVPIIIERAREDGPVLLLLGGIHGDEVNGVDIVRRIIRKEINKPLRGTVICIPVLNIFGYLNLKREFPDGRDLNRVFPGSEKGSLASRVAYHFKREIAHLVDYVIDFHTGGAERVNAPQVRLAIKEPHAFELAQAFGAPFIVNSKYIPKSVRYMLNKMGKTALLFEGGKTLTFDREVIDCGVQGTLNVMRHLKMQEGISEQKEPSIVITKSKWIRAPHSGMFHLLTSNERVVNKGAVLGIITDPFGEFEHKVKAPLSGHIFCVNTSPTVNRGDALFHISLETS